MYSWWYIVHYTCTSVVNSPFPLNEHLIMGAFQWQKLLNFPSSQADKKPGHSDLSVAYTGKTQMQGNEGKVAGKTWGECRDLDVSESTPSVHRSLPYCYACEIVCFVYLINFKSFGLPWIIFIYLVLWRHYCVFWSITYNSVEVILLSCTLTLQLPHVLYCNFGWANHLFGWIWQQNKTGFCKCCHLTLHLKHIQFMLYKFNVSMVLLFPLFIMTGKFEIQLHAWQIVFLDPLFVGSFHANFSLECICS